ncbi:hypothetical protein MUO65_03225 [bacterium]|nr:hypothetical protein [bacterium]
MLAAGVCSGGLRGRSLLDKRGREKVNMEPKDKLESLKFIAQAHRSEFQERRKHEWKIFFSASGLYIISVATIYGGKVELVDNSKFEMIIWMLFPFLAVVTTIFLGYIHMANNKNKTFAENAERYIIDLSEGKQLDKLPVFSENTGYWVSWGTFFKASRNSGRWSLIWQGVTLLVFSVISAILITLK